MEGLKVGDILVLEKVGHEGSVVKYIVHGTEPPSQADCSGTWKAGPFEFGGRLEPKPIGPFDPNATLDPWKHRSQGMKCGTCMWFVAKLPVLNQPDARGSLGRCRKHAPTMSGYPATFASDWCGDHKLDETKL